MKKKQGMKKRSESVELYTTAKIKVIGVGGAGGNAVTRMWGNLPRSVDLIAVNTDVQDLTYADAKKKIHIGKDVTRGLGTGMNPDLGRQAAEENRQELTDALRGADMVFITAGFGGGTGTGAAPIVAEIAKEMGILTVAVITKPFAFEGVRRAQIAEEGLTQLRDRVDTLITIPNDRIFSLINTDTPLTRAFEEIDEVLKNSVQGITELIVSPGIVNVDFADVKAIMRESGSAIIGIGKASGQERATTAANQALNSALLEISIDGAKGVLFSVSGQRDLKMSEVNDIARLISESVDPAARIIFGTYHDRRLKKGQVKVTLIATGFNGTYHKNNLLLPGLFEREKADRERWAKEESSGTGAEAVEETERVPDTTLFERKTEEGGGDKNEREAEVWDIPTFLRKKKKKK